MLKILCRACFSNIMAIAYRDALSVEIRHLNALMDRRLALADQEVDRCLLARCKKESGMTSDPLYVLLSLKLRRPPSVATSRCSTYKMRALRPRNARPPPMLRKLDGKLADTPDAVAQRWIEHFSGDLAGSVTSFGYLQEDARHRRMAREVMSMEPPSLDEVLDVFFRVCVPKARHWGKMRCH